MADPLSNNLQPASFRGVPFEVEGSDLEAGRRVQLHEYPQRDKPYVEDLGRATRALTINAFVVGADYVARANRVLAAIEEGGPGTLVHPWLGSMQVSVKDVLRVSFDRALGIARITFSFVEAGELEFPSAGSSTPSQSRLAASDLETAASASFVDTFEVSGLQDFVAASADLDIVNAFSVFGPSAALTGLSGYLSTATGALAEVRALVNSPSLLAARVLSFLRLTDLAAVPQGWANMARSLVRLVTSATLYTAPAVPAISTPSRLIAAQNTQAVQQLMRLGLLAQAVGASSLNGGTMDTSRGVTYNDQVALRNAIVQALDQEALRTASDDVYVALSAARARVWEDLTTRSRDSARLVDYSPTDTAPAVALAYDLYEDAGRDDEIVQRNRLRRPGFVPPQPLKVLTR